MPDAFYYIGKFPDTIDERLRAEIFSFVHADGDQFETTVAVCDFFPSRMVKGGMILFDDYYALDGCRLAVDAILPQREILPCGRALVRF